MRSDTIGHPDDSVALVGSCFRNSNLELGHSLVILTSTIKHSKRGCIRQLRMLQMNSWVFLCCLVAVVVGDLSQDPTPQQPAEYSDHWSVHVPEGHNAAKEVADTLGFHFHGQVRSAGCSRHDPDPIRLEAWQTTFSFSTNVTKRTIKNASLGTSTVSIAPTT